MHCTRSKYSLLALVLPSEVSVDHQAKASQLSDEEQGPNVDRQFGAGADVGNSLANACYNDDLAKPVEERRGMTSSMTCQYNGGKDRQVLHAVHVCSHQPLIPGRSFRLGGGELIDLLNTREDLA